MKRLMLYLVLAASACAGAPAFAADPPKAPKFTLSAYTGATSVVTRGERREYIVGRATLAGPVAKGFNVFLRGDLGGTQDGGGLDFSNPRTFRTIEVSGGLWKKVGPIEATGLAGATYSVEGDAGRPVDARLFTLAALARVPIGDGGYAYGGFGHHGPVGGPAFLFAASVPIGGAFSVIDFALPLNRTAFQEKAWVLKAGASVRVKRLTF